MVKKTKSKNNKPVQSKKADSAAENRKTKKHNENSSTSMSVFRYIKTKRATVDTYKNFYNTLDKQAKLYMAYYKFSGYMLINGYLRSLNKLRSGPRVPCDDSTTFMVDTHNLPDGNIIKQYRALFDKLDDKTTLGELRDIVYKYHYKVIYDSITHIDKVFNNPKIPKISKSILNGRPLYKGSTIPGIKSMKEGDVYTFNEYISTSFSPRVAGRFTGAKGLCDDSVIFVIKNPVGIPYIFLDWQAVNKDSLSGLGIQTFDEYEYVLPRGLSVVITKAYYTSEFNRYLDPGAIYGKLSTIESGLDKMTDSFFEKSTVIKAGKQFVIECEIKGNKWTPPPPIRTIDKKLNIPTKLWINFGDIFARAAARKSGKVSSPKQTQLEQSVKSIIA
jgi:hypothetical protein